MPRAPRSKKLPAFALWQNAFVEVGAAAACAVQALVERAAGEASRPHASWLQRGLQRGARLVDSGIVDVPEPLRDTFFRLQEAIDGRLQAAGTRRQKTEHAAPSRRAALAPGAPYAAGQKGAQTASSGARAGRKDNASMQPRARPAPARQSRRRTKTQAP